MSVRTHGASGFVAAVLRAVSWRAVLVTQVLGALFAVTPWLERVGTPAQPPLALLATEQVLTAVYMMLAAFAGDEAVRRGWSVLRSFLTVVLCAGAVTAITQWGVNHIVELPDPRAGVARILNTFFNVGSLWGTALMAYLNRQSAARLLSTLRVGELARVQAEQNLIGSHLAAADAQIDPDSLFHKLAHVRDLYASGEPDADSRFEALIEHLRDTVAKGR